MGERSQFVYHPAIHHARLQLRFSGEAHQARNGAAQAQEDAPLGQADRFQGWIGQVQGQAHTEHQARRTGPDPARGPVVMPTLDGGIMVRSTDPEDARRLIERLLSPPNNGPETRDLDDLSSR
ncbi:hypothetical protein MRS44_009765 [Fusarium solani]|uniref:uncharacterized protein n=1 Tax=Fusarium solani TaxID=169388 RepID=UPI0032C3F9A6|nr:hypothetical protein MRS44_009765 [Fusarium solani]